MTYILATEELELDLRLAEVESGEPGKNHKQVILNVSQDGTLTMSGRPVTIEALRQKLVAAVARNKEQAVLVRGEQAAQFGVGLQVLDTCRLAKINKVEIAALPARKG